MKLLLLAVLAVIFWPVLLPLPKVGNDLHLASPRQLADQLSLPYTWGISGAVGMGEYAVTVLWAWPVHLIFGLFSQLGVPFDLLLVILALLPALILGAWGMIKLAGWPAAAVYLTTTYFLLLVDGGQLSLALAYGILPVCFYLYQQRRIVKFTVATLALSVFDVRMVYLLAGLIAGHFIFEATTGIKNLFSTTVYHAKLAAGATAVLMGFHAYWLLPAILARPPSLPAGYDRPGQVDFLSLATWKHAILLQQPHWPKNVFGEVSRPRQDFLLLPVLAILGFVLARQKKGGYWLGVAAIGVFLAKGSSPPLGSVYTWLFEEVAGFNLFRDPTKFYFFIALAYSVLIGGAVEELTRRCKFSPWLLAAYLLYLASPVMAGELTGTFSRPRFLADYLQLGQKLAQDQQFGRVLWLPAKAPLGYSSNLHPALEGLRLVKLRPFAVGTVGTYEILNFLREASFSGQLLDVAGVKYVVYPPLDPQRDDLEKDKVRYHSTFSKQLSVLPWIKSRQEFGRLPLWETARHQDHFFLPQRTYFVVGSDAIYHQLELAQNALVFVEERPGLLARIDEFPAASVLNFKSEIDVAAALIPPARFVFPARQLGFAPDETGWWKREAADLIWWRDFWQNKYGLDNQDFDYGGGWAVAEGSKQLTVNTDQLGAGEILLARVMTSSRGGRLEFWQGDQLTGEVKTRIEKPAIFVWSEVGQLTATNQPVTIRTTGEVNVVNALASMSKSEWESLRQQGQNLSARQADRRVNHARVSYTRLDPTRYRVKVSGLTGPATLAFSGSYDSLWRVNGQSAVPLYSLINGFSLPGDGEYEVSFGAQKYVLPGLAITALTLVLLTGAWLLNSGCKRQPSDNRR